MMQSQNQILHELCGKTRKQFRLAKNFLNYTTHANNTEGR